MSMTWPEFLAQRTGNPGAQLFRVPGATRTIMVCSHIWWTEQIGFAFLQSGFNVLMHPPLYTLYTDPNAFPKFDELWQGILANIHAVKVDYLLGGNTSAMLVHPGTGELLHHAAHAQGRPVTLINWWWDEPRTRPPLARAGISPAAFVRLLNDAATVNAIWDIDVLEELAAQLGLTNLVHLPLATLPEFWPHGFVPLEQRPLVACFLGHCHFTADWIENDADPLHAWARQIVARKIAAPSTPMQQLIAEETATRQITLPQPADDPGDAAWTSFARPMEVLNAAYMHTTRNQLVKAAAAHLGGKLALIGKGWDKLGLRANMEHAGDKSGIIYGQSQISLNLFGGCVHGGLPLRPYDIGASGGLIVTHDQRELPDLFEPGKECLVFSNRDELIAQIDRIRAQPDAFNPVAQAGRQRVLAQHTWGHRIARLSAFLQSRQPS